MARIKVKISGIKELNFKIERLTKSIQTKMGIAASKGADIFVQEFQNHLLLFNAADSFSLFNSFEKIKRGPYTWDISADDYWIFVEYGFSEHWIHLNMLNPDSRKLPEFIQRANQNGFLKVGPMPPRPFRSTGINAAIPQWTELIKERVTEAIRAI